MTQLLSLEFLVAVLFIVDLFLILLLFLFVKRVNKLGVSQAESILSSRNYEAEEQAALNESAGETALASARDVMALLEPLVRESKEAALDFDELIHEKKKISKKLNDALDSRIISINLLLSRASVLQKSLEEELRQFRHSQPDYPPQTVSSQLVPAREPDVLDQQNQIIDLYYQQMDINTIAEQLSIPKGEVQLVIDLKEKFVAMEQEK